MGFITKELFLAALACPTRGWRQRNDTAPNSLSPADQLRIQEGMEIHRRARRLFPEGVMVGGSNQECLKQTKDLLSNPRTTSICEATFVHGDYIVKADILIRTGSHWKLIEVKSNVNDTPELVDDLAYTVFVASGAGLPISSCSLFLINKEFRLGMPNEKLFKEIDHTNDALVRAAEYQDRSSEIAEALSSSEEPFPELQLECRKCDIFDQCVGLGIRNHIFELPRISHTKFCQLKDLDIESIEDIPTDFALTEMQSRVRGAVQTGLAYVDGDGLSNALRSIKYPAHYLDFETVQTCLPLYGGVSPYEQLATQYSIHICDETGEVVGHREYLADPARDCRRILAENLIQDCGRQGSIVVYTSFEKTIIRGLGVLFPDLGDDLDGLIGRLFDLCQVLRQFVYHQDFGGSFSIKKVLPVVVPYMGYAGMAIDNGLDASAIFAYLARGKFRGREAEKVRRNLLEYCGLDTLAMVMLVQELSRMLQRMDEEGGERVAV